MDAERLGARLGELWATPTEIAGLRRLSGGASKQTWVFEARPRGGSPVRLVLRCDQPGQGRPGEPALEAALLRAATAAGVPVPALVDHCADDGALGVPYVLTEFLDGETIPRRLLREPRYAAARAGLARELGRVLARLHRVPVADVPGLPAFDPLDWLTARYDATGEPLPAVEIALRWLRESRPASFGDAVVHGDFRNGNLIVGDDGLRAVLDWELAHRGDPLEDLGWLCVKAWRFGTAPPVGGFGRREELFDGYAEVAGRRPDPDAVRWWEVYGTAKWAVLCRVQAERHLSGQTRSVELAAVGRRACEQEHDLLLALGAGPGEIPGEVTAPPSDLHGRPTAGELVTSVAEFLRSDVVPGTEGTLSFHARVAANVLGIVARQLRLGEEQERRHARRLAALGVGSTAELAAALRAGKLDPADPSVLAAVRADVTDRLAVADPRYFEHPA
ncbi:phosphotransferase family protein [Prauserella sp. PE36]|uniref:phosphotransferase family protein n=1 Tax=Prauserella sp. PE36 TaxID=1504709 RepID=UPI000DE263F6|nr:phosphotransferase family protein [Prauserella sp. PE36]RBM16297.1 phosphotransferase family protein [Prauserella sp. PE36]